MQSKFSYKLVHFHTKDPHEQGASYFIDRQTNEIYMADFKQIGYLQYILIVVFGLIVIRAFPFNYLLFEHFSVYFLLSLLIGFLCSFVGYYLNRKQLYNLRKVNLLYQEEVYGHLRTARLFYVRQTVVASIILILAFVCFFYFM